jgi:ubiquinone biosynthesis protein UbiJ
MYSTDIQRKPKKWVLEQAQGTAFLVLGNQRIPVPNHPDLNQVINELNKYERKVARLTKEVVRLSENTWRS